MLPGLQQEAAHAKEVARAEAEKIQAQIARLQKKLAAVHRKADEAAQAHDRRVCEVVQGYVDQHAAQVVEVPYEAHPELIGRSLTGSVHDWLAQLPEMLRHLAHRDQRLH